jgi:hypothetical protein
MPGNATFHPTIETMGFQTDFSVNPFISISSAWPHSIRPLP